MDPAFSLDSLKKDRTGFVIHQRKHAVKIVHGCELDISDHGLKSFPVVGISRYGKGAHGPAVERMIHGDDLMIGAAILQISIFPRGLDHSFNSLCTAVGEKYPVHLCCFRQLVRRFHSRHRIIIIGDMGDFLYLIAESIDELFFQLGITVAQGIDRDPRTEIQIGFSVGIIKVYALSVIKYDLIPVVSMEQ